METSNADTNLGSGVFGVLSLIDRFLHMHATCHAPVLALERVK
jgi:hypothetical protein